MRWVPLILGATAWVMAAVQWRIAVGRQGWSGKWPFYSERRSGLFIAGWTAFVGTLLIVGSIV